MRVHFIGIGGIAMSAVAGLAKEMGFEVSGSESNPIYSPAKDILNELGIRVLASQESNIDLIDPQYVVVGNAVKRDNDEVARARALGKEVLSFPQLIKRFILKDKVSLVVAGTHGKTTTSALLAWSLFRLSQDPTFVIGGLIRETGRNFRFGKGRYVVLEGDEYPSAYFDPVPKFFHYYPFGLILTSLEYDHADVFSSLEAYTEVFEKLVQSVSQKGVLVYHGDDPNLTNLIEKIKHNIDILKTYGTQSGDYRLVRSHTLFNGEGFITEAIVHDSKGDQFVVRHRLPGFYNSLNVISVLLLLEALGFKREELLRVIETFPGVKRRQEVLFCGRRHLLIDDFAHHPSAVKLTLSSLMDAFKPEITTLIFEPRTNSSRRKVFQEDYVESLSLADEIYLKEPPGLELIPDTERIDLGYVTKRLIERGKKVGFISAREDFTVDIYPERRQLLVLMSSAYMEREISKLKELLGRIYGR